MRNLTKIWPLRRCIFEKKTIFLKCETDVGNLETQMIGLSSPKILIQVATQLQELHGTKLPLPNKKRAAKIR